MLTRKQLELLDFIKTRMDARRRAALVRRNEGGA